MQNFPGSCAADSQFSPINSHNPGRFRRITLQVSFTRATERVVARYGQYAQAGKAFPYRGAVIGKIIPEATQQVVFFGYQRESLVGCSFEYCFSCAQ